MHVTYLILGKFPTQKAYGITTTETIRCLRAAGHDVTVYSMATNNVPDTLAPVEFTSRYYRENRLAKLLKEYAYSDVGFLPQFAWRIYWWIIYFSNKKVILHSKSDLFWVRDILALKMIPRNARLVFEIHQLPRKIWQLNLKSKWKFKACVISPISKKIEGILASQYSSLNTCYAPMGIRMNQISEVESVNSFIERLEVLKTQEYRGLKIGYIGKFSPNGFSKGVEDLIALAALCKKRTLKFNVVVKGGQPQELDWLKSLALHYELGESDIEISGQMSQELALAAMSNLDVIVLTNPSSVKYVGFPLKALEAVAQGRIVLAADCETYRNIFDSEYQPFWYSSQKAEDMLLAISQALGDPKLRERMLSGREFASRFLWENRTEQILRTLAKSATDLKQNSWK